MSMGLLDPQRLPTDEFVKKFLRYSYERKSRYFAEKRRERQRSYDLKKPRIGLSNFDRRKGEMDIEYPDDE